MASEAGEWLGGVIGLLFLRTAKQPRGGSNGSCTNTLSPSFFDQCGLTTVEVLRGQTRNNSGAPVRRNERNIYSGDA
jgi:hypothetical protein